MIGCVPETIPVKPGNPDESINSTKSVEEAKEIIETAKKNSRTSNRAKKTDEIEYGLYFRLGGMDRSGIQTII